MNIAELVELIVVHPGITPADIAAHFDVSERTLRNYVNKANASLEGIAVLELKRGRGYRVRVQDRAAFEDWCTQQVATRGFFVPRTPEERVTYLLNDLLLRSDWITLQELSNILYVSKSTLSRDLQKVEERLSKYDLVLEKRSHHGIRVVGDEMSRRLCLVNDVVLDSDLLEEALQVQVANSAPATSPAGATGAAGAIGAAGATGPAAAVVPTDAAEAAPAAPATGAAPSTAPAVTAIAAAAKRGEPVGNLADARSYEAAYSVLEQVNTCVEEVIRSEGYLINSGAYLNLLVHISVSIARVQMGCSVPMPTEQIEVLESSREYDVAQKIAGRLTRTFGVELAEPEVAYIAIHLAGKHLVGDAPAAGDGAGVVITDEIWGVVGRMLDLVWEVYRFDFHDDLELRMNLARHIGPLSVRMRYHMDLKNPQLANIRSGYPLAYSMAIDSSTVLVEQYGSRLSEDEIGYLAMAFALALERRKTEAPKKNILIVSASGRAAAQLMEHRFREEFEEYVGEITLSDGLDLGSLDFSRIDYVITTEHLKTKLPVPVCEVNLFLDESSTESLREFLRANVQEGRGSILGYFDRELFFAHLPYTTKYEVLDFLLDRAGEVRELAPNFRELVWKREGTASTSFENNVAMPHPLGPASAETFVCVGVLDQPVAWDALGHSAQVVFLTFFAEDAGEELQMLYSQLIGVMVSPSAVETIVEDQTWETLVGVLEAASEAADAGGAGAAAGTGAVD